MLSKSFFRTQDARRHKFEADNVVLLTSDAKWNDRRT